MLFNFPSCNVFFVSGIYESSVSLESEITGFGILIRHALFLFVLLLMLWTNSFLNCRLLRVKRHPGHFKHQQQTNKKPFSVSLWKESVFLLSLEDASQANKDTVVVINEYFQESQQGIHVLDFRWSTLDNCIFVNVRVCSFSLSFMSAKWTLFGLLTFG